MQPMLTTMKTWNLCLLVFACAAVPAHAATNGAPSDAPGPVTVTAAFVSQLADEARTNNAALRAADARTEAAYANAASVRTWEDPMIYAGGMGAEREMRMDEGDIIYGAEQKLPLFGKPHAERNVAKAEEQTAVAMADLDFQELRLKIAQASFDLALADRLVELGQEDLYWLEDLDSVTAERYRAGTASQVEMLRAQNERAKRATLLAVDQNTRDSRRLTLNRLLNRPLEALWPALRLPAIAEPVAYTPQLGQLALRYEARLKVLRQEVQTAAAMLEQTRRQRYPEVSVGVENRQYSGNGDTRQTMAELRMSLPWVNRSKYRADRAREEARLRAAEMEVQDYEVFVPNEVRRLTLSIDAARREALFYHDEFIPRSETAVTSARAQWTTGSGMFYDLIEARRMWIEGRVMEARAVAEQYRMLSELVLCCGVADLEALKMIGVNMPSEPEKKP